MIGDELFFYNALLYFPLISHITADTKQSICENLLNLRKHNLVIAN